MDQSGTKDGSLGYMFNCHTAARKSDVTGDTSTVVLRPPITELESQEP